MGMRGMVAALTLGFCAATLCAGEPAYSLTAKADKAEAVYGVGEEAVFTVNLLLDKEPAEKGKIVCRIDGTTAAAETSNLEWAGQPLEVRVKRDAPGWIRLTLTAIDADGKPLANTKDGKSVPLRPFIVGAVVDPSAVKPAVPAPDDFDDFWKKQRAALDAVPVKAVETEVETTERDKQKAFQCFDVTVECAGPKPVSGYLSFPKNAQPQSLPAVVIFSDNIVRSANKTLRNGAISFDVNLHGLANGQTPEFYRNLTGGELKNAHLRDAEDPDRFYIKDVFVRALRALDYVKTRPEWDGKTLIVWGGGLGGAQATAVAALDKDVTLCVASNPTMGDHNARAAGRLPGWPALLDQRWAGDKKAQVARTAGYYDTANFAARVRCETIMSVNLAANPTAAYAVYNNLPDGIAKDIDVNLRNTKGVKRIDAVVVAAKRK